jgi:hypothetical protein
MSRLTKTYKSQLEYCLTRALLLSLLLPTHFIALWRKISCRRTVILQDNNYSFQLPFHKADRFFTRNTILVTRSESVIDPVHHFKNYLASRDSLMPFHSCTKKAIYRASEFRRSPTAKLPTCQKEKFSLILCDLSPDRTLDPYTVQVPRSYLIKSYRFRPTLKKIHVSLLNALW